MIAKWLSEKGRTKCHAFALCLTNEQQLIWFLELHDSLFRSFCFCVFFALFFSIWICFSWSLFSDSCLFICFLFAINLLCSFFCVSESAWICSMFAARTFFIILDFPDTVCVCVCVGEGASVYKSQRHFIIICIRLTKTKSAYPVCWKMVKKKQQRAGKKQWNIKLMRVHHQLFYDQRARSLFLHTLRCKRDVVHASQSTRQSK